MSRLALLCLFLSQPLFILSQSPDSLSSSYIGMEVAYHQQFSKLELQNESVQSVNTNAFRFGILSLFNTKGKTVYAPRVSYLHSNTGNIYYEDYLLAYFSQGLEFAIEVRRKISGRTYLGLELMDRISMQYTSERDIKRNNYLGCGLSFGYLKGHKVLLNPSIQYSLGYVFHDLPYTGSIWLHSVSLAFSVFGSMKG